LLKKKKKNKKIGINKPIIRVELAKAEKIANKKRFLNFFFLKNEKQKYREIVSKLKKIKSLLL